MSFATRPSAHATRAVSRACVAMLAVLLSALGGVRLGLDRLVGLDEDDAPALCAVTATISAAQDCAIASTACPSAMPAAATRPLVPLSITAGVAACGVSAPSLLLGSAGGPRAP